VRCQASGGPEGAIRASATARHEAHEEHEVHEAFADLFFTEETFVPFAVFVIFAVEP
jgi:hypothetical protein